jgi:lipopolysaccharide transport system ATP-binding protein
VSDKTPGTISIKNVSKVFKKASGTSTTYSTLKTFLLQNFKKNTAGGLSRPAGFKRQKALDDVSLELPAGSSTALIGRNGSGKSTILKLIAGIYTPDSGNIQVHGKVSALIELGAGFHPDFTGRENIFLGGIMFGLSRKEIRKRFDDIVSYAELEHVIDEPVRTYSSGMYMRLGFSLAIHTNPDILLVDEVLAVGDAHFIHRCQDSISEFKRKGKTLVFVTHDLASVSKWCDEAVWLDRGKVRQTGHPREISDAYLGSIHEQEKQELENFEIRVGKETSLTTTEDTDSPIDPESKRWGNKAVVIDSIHFLDQEHRPQWIFNEEDTMHVEISFSSPALPEDLVFGVGIIRADGLEVFGSNTGMNEATQSKLTKNIIDEKLVDTPVKNGSIIFNLKRIGLTEGSYFMDVAAHAEDGTPYDYHHRMHKFQIRSKNCTAVGVLSPEMSWNIPSLSGELLKADRKEVPA